MSFITFLLVLILIGINTSYWIWFLNLVKKDTVLSGDAQVGYTFVGFCLAGLSFCFLLILNSFNLFT